MARVIVRHHTRPRWDRRGEIGAAALLDGRQGCWRLTQRLLQLRPGAELAGEAGHLGESWYTVAGAAGLQAAGQDVALLPGTAIWLRRGGRYRCRAGDTGLQVVLTRVRAGEPGDDTGPPLRVAVLADCPPERTGDREFRVLLGAGPLGDLALTQFAGVIPPGRAPAHQHTYDEVVYVLGGAGVAHAAGGPVAIGPGTSVYLPPCQPHCLENTGAAALTVLGVFCPSGSPAASVPAPAGR